MIRTLNPRTVRVGTHPTHRDRRSKTELLLQLDGEGDTTQPKVRAKEASVGASYLIHDIQSYTPASDDGNPWLVLGHYA